MPKVTAQGKTFECATGSNLRKVLLENDINLYNGKAKIINCMGIGTCGTCAVQVEGEVSEPNWKDQARRYALRARYATASSPFSHGKPSLSLSNPSFRRCSRYQVWRLLGTRFANRVDARSLRRFFIFFLEWVINCNPWFINWWNKWEQISPLSPKSFP